MEKTQNKFDKGIAITGAIIPVGIAIGNIAFEAAVVLTSLIWIARVIKFFDPVNSRYHTGLQLPV